MIETGNETEAIDRLDEGRHYQFRITGTWDGASVALEEWSETAGDYVLARTFTEAATHQRYVMGNRGRWVGSTVGASTALVCEHLRLKDSGVLPSKLLPASITTGTLEATDNGKCVYATGDITIPNNIMSTGDVVVIDNVTGSAIELIADIENLRLAATVANGNMQLAAYGICAVLFESPTAAKVSGTGLAFAGDADAEVFFSTAGITDEGVRDAVTDLAIALKGFDLWDKMVAIYPFVQNPGDNDREQQKYNLKDPAAYPIAWNSAPTASDNGITGDGVDDYGDTGLDISLMDENSIAFGFYSRTNLNGSFIPMGAWDGSDGLELYPRLGGSAYFDNSYNGGTGRITAVVADSLGLFVSSRTGASASEGYKNGVSVGSSAGATGAVGSADMFVLVRGGGSGFSAHNLAFAFVSSGLNDAENADLYTAVQAFQTALSRQV